MSIYEVPHCHRLAEALRNKRKALGLSQQELAENANPYREAETWCPLLAPVGRMTRMGKLRPTDRPASLGSLSLG
jgi:hypothetical protein